MLVLGLIKNVRVKYLSLVFLVIFFGSSVARSESLVEKNSAMKTHVAMDHGIDERVPAQAKKSPSTTWEYLEWMTGNYSNTHSIDKSEIKKHKNLLFRFFDILQKETVKYYQTDANNIEMVYKCLKTKNCEKLEELQHAAQQYRIITLHRSIRTFKNMPSHIGYYPAKGTAQVYIDLKTEKGRREIKFLLEKYKEFQEQTRETFAVMQAKAKQDGVSPVYETIREWHTYRYKERHDFYSKEIASLIERYPLLAYLSMREELASREQLMEAAKRAYYGRAKVVSDIKNLKKNTEDPISDSRFELLGFAHILPKALIHFKKSEITMISNFVAYLQAQAHWLNRIYSILTNYQTLLLAACHMGTYSLAPYPHPIVQLVRLGAGFACGAYGSYATVKAVAGSTLGVMRQLSYLAHTKQFDEGVLSQYMTNYVATVIMAGIYLKTSLPGLVNRAVEMKSQYGRLRGGSIPYKYDTTILKETGGLVKRYATYYGEEIAINELLFIGGKLQGSVNVVQSSVYKVVMNAFSREFKILTYTDVVGSAALKMTY